MRGRKPTPTTLRILRGNPGRRPLNDQEPKPADAGVPAPPTWLKDEAAKEWARLAPILHTLGLLTELDTQALTAYCRSYQRWREAEDQIDKFGTVIKGKGGFPVASPFVAVATRAMREVKGFLIEFGMTPSARSRVHTGKDDEPDDPFAEFDSGRLERWNPEPKKPASG